MTQTVTTSHIDIKIANEAAVILYVKQANPLSMNADVIAKLHYWQHQIRATLTDAIIEMTPSYASLLVQFDPRKIDHYHLRQALKAIVAKPMPELASQGKLVSLPVYYDLDVGPDLERIANAKDMTIEQVIDLHQSQEYRVFTIGFAPGFGYLGELDERLAMPRLATPRAKVAKGSVAIADRQTAIYPAQSPGGWNIIGRCPIRMFDPNNEPNMPFTVGDRVRFYAIDKHQFLELGGQL